MVEGLCDSGREEDVKTENKEKCYIGMTIHSKDTQGFDKDFECPDSHYNFNSRETWTRRNGNNPESKEVKAKS